MNKTTMVIAVVAVVCVAAVGGYIVLSDDGEAHDIVLAVGTKNCYEPFWIADGKGFFEEEGVKVKIVYVDGGGNATAALLSGSADMTLVGADPAIRLFNNTTDGMAIATIETALEGESRDFAYIDGKGIDVSDASTLLNRTEGQPSTVKIFCGIDTTTGYYSGYISYLYSQWKAGNITETEYKMLKTLNDGNNGGGIVHVPFDQQITSLQSGSTIQMICSGTNIQLAGSMAGISTDSSDSGVVSCCVVIVTGEALEKKSEAITKMLRAFDKACAYIENEDTRDEAIRFCTDFYGSGSSWTAEMQTNFFNTQYWDICQMKDLAQYLNDKAALLGHEGFDCSDRIIYDFLIEIHDDMKFIYDPVAKELVDHVPA